MSDDREGGVSTPPSFKESDEVQELRYPNETDPPPHREKLRGRIAVWLLAIFTLEIVAVLAAILFLPDRLSAAKEVIVLIMTPTLTLLGAVTGFYYGAKDN